MKQKEEDLDYAVTITADLPYEEAVPKVKEAFKEQGFGTLTEIDGAELATLSGSGP